MTSPNSSALVQVGQDPAAAVETAANAMATSQKAMIEASYVVALRNPRDLDRVRQRLLKECDRPGFAEAARYAVPRAGKTITGLSIRFAEAAGRELGNLSIEHFITFDDLTRRGLKVVGIDLETNWRVSIEDLISKTVERTRPDTSREKLGERKNTKGETVFLYAATDDEVRQKELIAVSKARRNIILAFLPGDIVEECEARVNATIQDRDRKDPMAALRTITDNFYKLGVDASVLKRILEHDLEQITPAEIGLLRSLYVAVKEGEATVADILAAAGKRDSGTEPAATDTKGIKGLAARLNLRERPAKKTEPEPAAAGAAGDAGDAPPPADGKLL